MGEEEKFIDVLQNMEFMIVSVYKKNADMTDFSVMRALEALVSHYRAESLEQTPKAMKLSEVEAEIVEGIKVICEIRLGRGQQEGGLRQFFGSGHAAQNNIEDILYCLRKLLKSARNWNKKNGRQGYLNFIVNFVQ